MESTERLVRTWMASGRDEEIEQTVSEISQDQSTLINVVKALGEYLTSEEDELRTKGVDFLSSVLGRCPVDKLNLQSVRVLTSFYCGKLDDTETIIPALKGLVTLASLPACSSAEATSIIQALFGKVKMKVLVQSVRFNVFTIIDTIMALHRDALRTMGKHFIAGYISLAEGEKDPRNLLVAFAIARVILIEFDISSHTESLFDITFCYFPITFRPPPNDPYGISTDDLRLALRKCLGATPAFGPLAIPVFIEKLTAGSPATKRDTLQAMNVSLPIYGPALARAAARKLWNALKLEVFQPIDTETEEDALKTIRILVHTIYSEQESALELNEDIQGLVRDACEECIQILREPEKTSAKPAIKILCAFLTTTPSISRYTLSLAMPHLMKLFHSADEIPNRAPILLLLADLINAVGRSTFNKSQEYTDIAILPLLPLKDEILGAVNVGLQAVAPRRGALAVIMSMIKIKSLLSDEEVRFVVHMINELLKVEEDENDDISRSILDVLMTISVSSPKHILEQTLPLLFSSLPDQAPLRDATAERAKCWRVLSSLGTLCVPPELFEILVIRLTAKIDLVCAAQMHGAVVDREPNSAYAHSLLQTIADTLSTKVDAGHSDVANYVDHLVPSLYNLFIYSAILSNVQELAATDARLVSVARHTVELVIQCLPLPRQQAFSTTVFQVFILGDIQAFAVGLRDFPPDSRLVLFDESAPTFQKNLIALFAAGIVPLHKEVRLPSSQMSEFLGKILIWSLVQSDNDLQRVSAWHLISCIVNKCIEDVADFLRTMLDSFWSERVIDPSLPIKGRQQAIKAWVWISKALLVRNHPLSPPFTNRLFEAFSDEDISWDAAKAIGEVAALDPILTKRNHAVVKILHAQKFVNSILPRIMAGSREFTKPREQTANLVALTSLIKAIPRVAYAHEMSSLIPLLLHGLEIPDVDIRANVIDTFLAAAEGDSSEHSLISEHASTLVTCMLKNSMVDEMSSTRVRIAALQYLGVLPGIVRYDVLHPYKAMVIRELAKVLDDPKRSVRKEAVYTRTNWFTYNG